METHTSINNALRLVLLSIMLSWNFLSFSQNKDTIETTKPLMDIEIERSNVFLDLENTNYDSVTISLHSYYDSWHEREPRVEVNVVSKEGKSIYNKTLKNVYLYVFSNGTIQVGKMNFNQVYVYYKNTNGQREVYGIIREKEGIF